MKSIQDVSTHKSSKGVVSAVRMKVGQQRLAERSEFKKTEAESSLAIVSDGLPFDWR
jgi:hypothetical protein